MRAQARPGMIVALAGVGGVGQHALPMARPAPGREPSRWVLTTPGCRWPANWGRISWQELADTMELAAQGRVTPAVDRVFALADVELAFESLRRGEPLGRDVLAV